MLSLIFSDVESNFILALVFIIGVVVSTMFIWDNHDKTNDDLSSQSKRKHRRDSPVARLMDMLDEDERYELLRRLTAEQDGELVGLDTLLREE